MIDTDLLYEIQAAGAAASEEVTSRPVADVSPERFERGRFDWLMRLWETLSDPQEGM